VSEQPSRRDRLRPLELLGLAAVLAVFVGVIAFIGSRSVTLALIGLGVTFILSIVVFATLALTLNPPSDDERQDMHEQDDDQDRGH
jgi:membrane protein implicated in regulation of membrane protease activity